MIDEQSFREEMPVFADSAQYPTFQFNFYLNLGKKLLNEDRWEDLLDYGLTLFIAHYLTLYKRGIDAASVGGDAGKVVGNETSKAVDSVSKSMDVSGVTIADAGHWNQTTWGVQFYQLMMMVGAGGVQI
ncbi:DUF4054 domain-containing protein [Acinetobacter haemolyticus]|uniref:Bacteriophage protein n=1 Tax=Acinetobacter haemolyticus ATCC 19194 TaxID=707232 RepID=D4XRQ5_ACIHA|nr:DUF4054 domain-containing protein [Acinetobacter haemolyticus]EFF82115.1 hypothetical protein HMP0015_2397 [Acinetobacter haemolyticus ATCC 19194]